MPNMTRYWKALLFLVAAVRGFVPTTIVKTAPSQRQRQRHILQATTSTEDSCDIAVYGGGFGGLYTALAISRAAKLKGERLDVALVEPSENFVFLPLLYDLTVGTATEAEVCPSYNGLLEGTGVRQIRASLESLSSDDNNNRQIQSAAVLKPSAPSAPTGLSSRASVVAVGASPDSILKKIPGAMEFSQPFYEETDAKKTRRILSRLEEQAKQEGYVPRVAIVGGGFGGVEMAASVKRKLPSARVSLLTRGRPMAGTRAEPLIDKALQKLCVEIEECSVNALEAATEMVGNDPRSQPVIVKREKWGEEGVELDLEPWDVVFWTAGSGPSYPVTGGLDGLRKSDSGRLAVDSSLRCFACEEMEMTGDIGDTSKIRTVKFEQPPVWALGDCSEIVSASDQPAVPKTAQAAMQQADTVAFNVLSQLEAQNGKADSRRFQYQDLGSMLTLGGPNAALMAPQDGAFAPLFAPALDAAAEAFGFADKVLSAAGRTPVAEKFGVSPETLGLSLGSYGLGVDSGAAPGTLAGTLTGAARRAVYAARMPTNQQRAVAGISAAISTAAALAREASSRSQD